MDEATLSSYEALIKRATPRPWVAELAPRRVSRVLAADAKGDTFIELAILGSAPTDQDNAKFIAMAREALPALVNGIREMRLVVQDCEARVALETSKADAAAKALELKDARILELEKALEGERFWRLGYGRAIETMRLVSQALEKGSPTAVHDSRAALQAWLGAGGEA